MPGRLLSFVRMPSSPKTPNLNPQAQPASLLPPYSFDPPPHSRTNSQESLIMMNAFRRHSFGRDKKAAKVEPPKAATMAIEVESPPIVFYNCPQTSTGAIFSGQLRVNITDPQVTFVQMEIRLLAIVHTKKPVAHHCPRCSTQTTEIHKWDFMKGPVTLKHGLHSLPFSHLLPGHLPATTYGSLAKLTYVLAAEARSRTGDTFTLNHDLEIKRAIFPGSEKNSIRIFPPTNLTASVTLPPVIHPIGDFPIEMRLSGIVDKRNDSQSRWKLRKLTWRLEEAHKSVSPACDKHAHKVGGVGKGVLHEDVRIIANEEVKQGCWKTDFDQGNIDVEFRAACNTALKSACDMESPDGVDVKHTFIIEMVVVEEWAPFKKPNFATPTGAARVLRTQFNIILTERAGLGISWDEEQPPTYENVPPSPPTYVGHLDDFPLDDDENSSLNL